VSEIAFKLSFNIASNSQRKIEMKMFTSLPLYIVTALFAIGCVAALPSVPQQDPGVLENIEKTVGEPCPHGWTRFDNYCYLVSSSSKTWSQAQAYCKSLGGGLVKINSAEENEFVLNLVTETAPSLKQVWIGLKWSSTAFYWYDHSVPVYTNWAPNEPSGNAREPCGHMWMDGHSYNLPIRAAGYWNDLTCGVHSSLPNGIVCERLP